MKKIVWLGLISHLFFIPAYALEDYGFYTGIEATATWWEFEADTTVQEPFAQNNIDYTFDDWNYSALFRLGGFYLWGEDERIYTAIEFFGEPHDIDFYYDSGSSFIPGHLAQKQQTQSTYTLGGQLKQGYFITEDLLTFLTAGFIYTQYKIVTDFIDNTVPGNQLLISQKDKFYRPALRFGAGAEFFLTNSLSVDAQAAYNWYESKTIPLYAQKIENNNVSVLEKVGNTDFDPSAVSIGVGFNFYFSAIIDKDN